MFGLETYSGHGRIDMIKPLFRTAAAAVLAGALLPAASFAQTELKVATLAPEGTPWYDFIAKWKENVEAASNGELQLTIFPNAQLGNELEVWNKVARGRVDIGVFTAAPMTENVPVTALLSTPFLFEKSETIYCVLDRELREDLTAMMSDKFQVIDWAENGWVQVYAQDDLSDVANAEGYKIRAAPHAMSRTLMTSIGANAIEIPYADTPAALQTGLVKGGESIGVSYVAFGINKVAPHLTVTSHSHQSGVILMGKKNWGKLSAEHQKILGDATPDLSILRQGIAGMDAYLLGLHEKAGGGVHRLTPEQRAAWKAKVEPNWASMVESMGPEAQAFWPKVLEAKKACGE